MITINNLLFTLLGLKNRNKSIRKLSLLLNHGITIQREKEENFVLQSRITKPIGITDHKRIPGRKEK